MAQNQFLSSPFEEIKIPEGFEIIQPPKAAAPAPAPQAPAPAPQAAQPARRGMGPSRDDVVRRATEMDVDPVLALSIYTQESGGGRNTKTSPKGAMGGFQVMPDTYAQMMGTRAGMDDPWSNMEAGLRYIAYGQKVLKTRDPALLAAGYHAGYNRDSLKRGEIPDVSDGMINTRDYARSVAARAGGADPGRFKPLSTDEVKGLGLDGAEPGRFQPLSPDEVAALTKGDQPADGGGFMGTLTDIGKNLKIGFNTAAEDVRELVGRIPGVGKPLIEAGDAVDRYFHPEAKDSGDLLKRDTKAMTKSMTPAMQQALEKKWWDSEKGTFGPAWSDWRSYAGGVVQSLPEQAITMVPAMGLAKGVYAARVAAGASEASAAAAAATAAQLAGSLSEGLLGGAQSSREVREKVSQLPQDVLDTSEAYQTLLAQGMSRDAARSALANDLSTRAFLTSGVVTGLFGGMGDRAIAKLFTEQVGKRAFTETVKSFGKGALAEGVFEELPQSVGQQLAQNEALKRANPKQSITEDVVNQGLGGMVLGGLQGGGMGAMARGRGNTPAPAAPAPEQPAAPVAAVPVAPAAAPVAAPVQPVENAPSKAAGPLQRAVENAAAEPERVTVETPAGAFTGQVTGKSADGQVQVVSDDGEIVTFKIGENGISITPEAPNTPLSNALEVASEQHAEAPAAPPPAVEQPAQPVAQVEQVAPAPEPAPAPAPVAEPATAPAAAPDFSAMGEAELRERLKYLATQAKTNGGWDKKLVQQRRVIEKEINARVKAAQPELAPVAETAAPAQTEAEAAAPATVEAPAPVAAPAPAAEEPKAAPAEAKKTPSPAALDRIAAGKAWFNDGVKAKNFITKNGLAETHEAVKGKGGRWDIVAKAAPAASKWTQGKTVNDWNEWVKDYGDGLTASVVQAGPKSFVSSLADATGSPSNSFRTLEEAQQATDSSAARRKEKEASNGSDQRAQRQPDVAEEVERAEAAPAAPVQPAAPAQEEVAPAAGLQELKKQWAEAARSGDSERAAQLNEQIKAAKAAAPDDKAPVKTGDAMADYWANSASASIESDVKAGRSKVVDLTGEMAPQIDAAQPEAQTQPAEAPKESNDGSQELDQPRTRELAGEQPQPVQGTEPDGQAGRGSEEGGRADAPGDERAGEPGVQQPGGLGDDAGEVPAPAARKEHGRAEQGSGPIQRGDQPADANPAGDEPGRAAGGERSLEPEHGIRAQDRSDNFVITDEDAIGEGGAKTKFKQNIAAIRLLKKLEAEGRQATRKEQAVLAKYVGWGGLPQAFYRDNGEVSKGWEKEAAELKGLLTPQELAAAASSTRNAHYTSPEIVQGVWKAVEHFGFQGGRTLEPSVGVGNFFGLMPAALRDASQLTGVELDHITGGIAKQLYPQANIQAPVGFQDFSAPDNYFELAIGNPPFGREGIYDATRRKISGFSIHNYFFAKSIDTVKPNGVLAMVVTNRLLDSAGDKARAYIAERAEFLGAIRLPNNAFLKNAGTEVTTDIIFLRKLKEGEQPTGQKWMEVKQFTDKNGKQVPLNEYFVRNPEMMLGEFGQFGSMYSAEDAALVARPGQDTAALMNEAIAKLPQGFMDPPTLAPVSETIDPLHDVSHVKVGSVFEQGGQIFERREDLLGKPQAAPVAFPSEKAKERVSGMIQVRDALVEVRSLQLQEGVKEAKIEAARAQLNKVYDAFVKANGPLNADANKRLMRDDPTWPQIAALEDGFDKGVSATVAKATGEKARPPSAKKAAIFFKRTQAPYKAPQSASSAKDALVTSLAERGRVDLDYMASLYKGHTPEAIAKDLGGLIFKNPAGGWETRDQYLSGNVKKKLAQAIAAAKADPAMRANVEALQAVQPADIEAVDIDVKVGAHWVPGDVMEAFIAHVTEGTGAKAVYNPVTAFWTLDVSRVPASAAAQWSTDRASVVKVLEAAANQKQITVYDEQRDGTRVFNEAATTAANEKVERVKAEWKNWLWSDDARRQRLSTIYNDTFNTDVQRDFDGAHLTFPGKVGDDIVSLRPHQANAIWRIVQSDTTLLDHVVGAGKTFTVIGAAMEMRRMGLAKKPAVVVPNHLVGQWAVDFLKLYPGANILAATKKDFEKENRKRLFARIATGDWDAVILAHSSFGKVEVEPEFQEAFIRQQIEDMDSSIALMRAAEGKSSRNVKQIEKQKAALEEKLKRLFDTGSKDDNLYFGELGIDALFVDEAHEFKNLGFSTGMQRVAGLGNSTGSNKAADLFMKVQATLKRTGGRNVVFATGTPISNTMAEMYTMQRYLDYFTLKDQGIAHFDAWAKTFGEVVTDWELSPSGQYKINSRFAKFVNMPELMQRYQSFADVVNRDDINRMLAAQGKKLPVPKVATGKPENIVVPRSDLQADYIGVPTVDDEGNETYPEGSLVWRAENLPKKAEKGADNMLKIMSDARKAALDMRLINPSLPDNPDSKVNVAADNIKAIYDKWHKDQGTQLVFIDLSTPKGAKAKEAAALRELVKLAEQGDEAAQEKLDAMSPDELMALDGDFSVYDDLRDKLIARGIPANEIAFIHDANTEQQKEELFGKVRNGRVRVLFGSTAKMGAGMNVQDRLVALHHLDAPWRPSDLEQREGRIIRQGNKLYERDPENFEVRIQRYATKQTLDSRMWQTIEAKARFIEQVRKGSGSREVEDIAGEAANSAEMKAASSGNPLILEEMSLRQQIRKLENQQSEHNREQYRIKDRIRGLEFSAEKATEEAAMMDKDAGLAPEKFAATIGNQTFDKHGEAGEAILAAVDAMHKAGEESRDIGTYGGFKLRLDDASNAKAKGAVLTMIGKAGEYQTNADPGSSNTGLALRMQNTVKDLGPMAEELRQRAKRQRADIPKLQAQIGAWVQAQELAEAKARHAAVITELRPKKKDKAAPGAEEAPAAARQQDLEEVFKSLDGRGLAKQRAEEALAGRPDADTIRYVENNFWNILADLDDSGMVEIKC